jgi:hypothetical protein
VVPEDLTAPERALWDGDGEVVDVRTEPERTVRAAVLAGLLLRDDPRQPPLRLRGARITGRLDLSYADVARPVEFADCAFDEGVGVAEATTRSLGFLRCELPSLDCDTVTVRSHLALVGSRIGHVSLYNADIVGQLDLSGAHLSVPGDAALGGELLHVGGSLYAHDLVLDGSLDLPNASIAGRFELDRATLRNAGGTALLATDLAVGAGLHARDATIEGRSALRGARIGGSLDLSGSRLTGPVDGEVLGAARLTVGHDLTGVRLVTGGTITLHGARIEGAIELQSAHLRGAGGKAGLHAYGMTVGAGVFCSDGFRSDGGVTVLSSQIAGRINLRGAALANAGGVALNLNSSTVGGNLDLRGSTTDGRVSLWQTTVGGQLDLAEARLAEPGGVALGCRELRARALLLGPDTVIDGAVDLRGAAVGTLRDDPARWPETVRLDGFAYETVDPPLPAGRRLAWLRRDPDGYLPRTYEQLAAAYRRLGHDHDARAVLAAKQRHRHESGPVPARVWGFLQDVTVGYGYRPGRAGAWLLLLVVVGTVLFGLWRPRPVDPGHGPAFHPFVYTVDVLLPIVDFGQEQAYQPTGATQWLAYGLVAAGWLLATTVAAGLANVLKRT